MYKSPIEIIQQQLQTSLENEILTAVQKVGVLVDKEELIKALKFDREQYDKGYERGYLKGHSDAMASLVRRRECIYFQDNNGGYIHEGCRWGHDETPDADDFFLLRRKKNRWLN